MKDILINYPIKILQQELINIRTSYRLEKKRIIEILKDMKSIKKLTKEELIELLIKYNYDISKLPKLEDLIKPKKEPKPRAKKEPKPKEKEINNIFKDIPKIDDVFKDIDKKDKYRISSKSYKYTDKDKQVLKDIIKKMYEIIDKYDVIKKDLLFIKDDIINLAKLENETIDDKYINYNEFIDKYLLSKLNTTLSKLELDNFDIVNSTFNNIINNTIDSYYTSRALIYNKFDLVVYNNLMNDKFDIEDEKKSLNNRIEQEIKKQEELKKYKEEKIKEQEELQKRKEELEKIREEYILKKEEENKKKTYEFKIIFDKIDDNFQSIQRLELARDIDEIKNLEKRLEDNPALRSVRKDIINKYDRFKEYKERNDNNYINISNNINQYYEMSKNKFNYLYSYYFRTYRKIIVNLFVVKKNLQRDIDYSYNDEFNDYVLKIIDYINMSGSTSSNTFIFSNDIEKKITPRTIDLVFQEIEKLISNYLKQDKYDDINEYYINNKFSFVPGIKLYEKFINAFNEEYNTDDFMNELKYKNKFFYIRKFNIKTEDEINNMFKKSKK
jgi:hypothetical protein